MKYYPAYLDLRARSCVVVGGGKVAGRKVLSLFDAGADVTVVSPTVTDVLRELADKGKINHRAGTFEPGDLDGVFLAVAATDSAETNSAVARLCRERNILVNVASPPELSTFIVPSVVERGDLLIAVSTSGVSPALARKLREQLEATFGPEFAVYLEKLEALRRKLLHETPDEAARRRVFQAVVDSDVLYLIKAGAVHEAEQRIAELVSAIFRS